MDNPAAPYSELLPESVPPATSSLLRRAVTRSTWGVAASTHHRILPRDGKIEETMAETTQPQDLLRGDVLLLASAISKPLEH